MRERRETSASRERSIRHTERLHITLLKPFSWNGLSTLRRVIMPSSTQHFKLWPSAFSPFYSAQDRLFCLTISVNRKLQQPTSWAILSGHSFWNSERLTVTLLKQDSWVELSATLRRVRKHSSSWQFKLWPSAFSPFHSSRDRQFWLVTSINQKPQKPKSWVTLD